MIIKKIYTSTPHILSLWYKKLAFFFGSSKFSVFQTYKLLSLYTQANIEFSGSIARAMVHGYTSLAFEALV